MGFFKVGGEGGEWVSLRRVGRRIGFFKVAGEGGEWVSLRWVGREENRFL